jgi:hypothetical protein
MMIIMAINILTEEESRLRMTLEMIRTKISPI